MPLVSLYATSAYLDMTNVCSIAFLDSSRSAKLNSTYFYKKQQRTVIFTCRFNVGNIAAHLWDIAFSCMSGRQFAAFHIHWWTAEEFRWWATMRKIVGHWRPTVNLLTGQMFSTYQNVNICIWDGKRITQVML